MLMLVLYFTCQFSQFSLIKKCKIYPEPMLPPSDRNWQLICPNCKSRGEKDYKLLWLQANQSA